MIYTLMLIVVWCWLFTIAGAFLKGVRPRLLVVVWMMLLASGGTFLFYNLW